MWRITTLHSLESGDCADKVDVHPGVIGCDGIDNDCSDGVDEIGAGGCTEYYRDEIKMGLVFRQTVFVCVAHLNRI